MEDLSYEQCNKPETLPHPERVARTRKGLLVEFSYSPVVFYHDQLPVRHPQIRRRRTSRPRSRSC